VKTCRVCEKTKPLTDFHRRTNSRDGVRLECKVCHRAAALKRYHKDPARHIADAKRYVLKRRYGLTPETWTALLISQAGRCAICDNPMCRKNEPHVDHDHDTKKVRGMLCSVCNTAIGQLGDSVDGLRRALAYLEATY